MSPTSSTVNPGGTVTDDLSLAYLLSSLVVRNLDSPMHLSPCGIGTEDRSGATYSERRGGTVQF